MERSAPADLRVAACLGFLTIATQRFGFSIGDGSVQATFFVLLIATAWTLFQRRGHIRPRMIVLYSLVVAAAAMSTVLGSNDAALTPSVTSFALFVLIYSVVLTAPPKNHRIPYGASLFAGAAAAMVVAALLGVFQFVAQRVGLGFIDPISSLPADVLMPGFNSLYDLEFAGGERGQFKPNGMLLLEPSFLSLFSAIGLVYYSLRLFSSNDQLRRLSGVSAVVILLGGLAVSASSSGIVVLGVAAIPLLLSVRRNRGLVALLLAAFVAALSLGLFNATIQKALEGFGERSSTTLRLVKPYELLAPYFLERPVFGGGAGTVTDATSQLAVVGLQSSTVMKLLVEYGLVGALIMLVAAAVVLARTNASRILVAAMLAAWLIPAEALLNSGIVLLLFYALPNWGGTCSESPVTPAEGRSLAARSISSRRPQPEDSFQSAN
jgi:hypothetical protein